MVQSGSAQREPSMEEILASIRRIIEDSDSVRQPNDESLPDFPRELEADVREVAAFRASLDDPAVRPVFAGPRAVTEESSSAPASVVVTSDAEVAETVSRPVFQQEGPQTEPEERAEPVLAAPAVSTANEAPAPRPAIISDSTGRQVAAAFGELSEAFAASRRRSFDEMAEEMLRPMLQDWLDNNLPTLVERLVREEIERVARGAQD